MTQRLPVPGGDNGTWGDILNGFLEVSLNADGTLSTSALSQAGGVLTSSIGQPSGVAGLNSSGLVPTTQLATGTASSSNFLRGDGTWVTPNSGSSALAADSDVAIVSPSNNQVLTYVSGSGKWENIAPAVATVFGRTGAITATTGDYTASQVTGALVNTNNLSDVSDAGSSRANIHIPVLTPAAAVAVANIASLTTSTTTVDNYSLASGDLVLLTAQTTASQNGLWSVPTSGSWTRPTEFASGANVKGRTCAVLNGTTYGSSQWTLESPTAGVTVDTSSQTWAQVGSKSWAPISAYAPLASPALTGTPTAPTQVTATDTSTQIATDAFVQNAISATVSSISLYLTGSGAPSSSLGYNGDYYKDVTTGYVYGPKASGSWPTPSLDLAQAVGVQVLTSGSITVPDGVTLARISATGGGGGGGGGGSATTTAGISDQVGGAGAGAGAGTVAVATVSAGQSLTVTIGAGGAGGGGGAANDNPGSAGSNGSNTTVTGSSPTVSVIAYGGAGGNGGAANSSAVVAAGIYGGSSNTSHSILSPPSPGCGSPAQSSGMTTGGASIGNSGAGGTGGGWASATLGGAGGGAGGIDGSTTTSAPGSGGSGTASGTVGGTAAANSGSGGGGGGGGAPGGAGGNGGTGGSGWALIEWIG